MSTNSHERLLDLLAIALLDHQRIEPHHTDLCRLCCAIVKALEENGTSPHRVPAEIIP